LKGYWTLIFAGGIGTQCIIGYMFQNVFEALEKKLGVDIEDLKFE
jgi:hypothetical protein